MTYYKIDILKDDISFKSYNVLLNNLPSESQLMQVINLRNTPDYEIKDINLLKIKRSLELQNQISDPLKTFATKFIKGK